MPPLDALAATIRERGFVILERHLDAAALESVRRLHALALDADMPRHRSLSATNTRTHLVDPPRELDLLWLDPTLLGLCVRVLPHTFKLGSFLARTVHAGAGPQELHVDHAPDSGEPVLLGFIYMLDAFTADGGATRFVRRDTGDVVVAIAPAGSLVIHDGAVVPGFSANRSAANRRSLQGAFVARGLSSWLRDERQRPASSDLARILVDDPPPAATKRIDLLRLREALEASWDHRTSYGAVAVASNPASGQCYPTARVVQWFFPETEIVSGSVDTGAGSEGHFWNALPIGNTMHHIDLTWQQFPLGSRVRDVTLLDRTALGDSPPTIERCDLLRQRVLVHLAGEGHALAMATQQT